MSGSIEFMRGEIDRFEGCPFEKRRLELDYRLVLLACEVPPLALRLMGMEPAETDEQFNARHLSEKEKIERELASAD